MARIELTIKLDVTGVLTESDFSVQREKLTVHGVSALLDLLSHEDIRLADVVFGKSELDCIGYLDSDREIYQENDTLRYRLLKAKEDLLRYGGHHKSCVKLTHKSGYCSCGFRSALASDQYNAMSIETPEALEEKEQLVSQARILLDALSSEEWDASPVNDTDCGGCTADGCFGHYSGYYELSGPEYYAEDIGPGFMSESAAKFIEFARNNLAKLIGFLRV